MFNYWLSLFNDCLIVCTLSLDKHWISTISSFNHCQIYDFIKFLLFQCFSTFSSLSSLWLLQISLKILQGWNFIITIVKPLFSGMWNDRFQIVVYWSMTFLEIRVSTNSSNLWSPTTKNCGHNFCDHNNTFFDDFITITQKFLATNLATLCYCGHIWWKLMGEHIFFKFLFPSKFFIIFLWN